MDAKTVTIVTGGGRGIGRAIALRMAKETAVFLVGQTESYLAEVTKEIMATGGLAHYLVGDVADPKTADLALAACKGFDKFNVVCNAAIGGGGPTETYSDEAWLRVYGVNVHGVFFFIQRFLSLMIPSGGSICLMSSTDALKPSRRNMPYGSSKAAVNAMAQSLTAEHAKNNIRCVAICPNFVAGEMTDRTIKNYAAHNCITEDEARQYIIDTTPEKRLIPPEEIAEAVSLICDGSLVPTGSVLVINGEKR